MNRIFQCTSFSYLLLFISLLIPGQLIASPDNSDGCKILEKVFNKNRSIKTLSVTMDMRERIDGEVVQKRTQFKVNFSPYKVYMKQAFPYSGLELLYADGENNGKVLINRNTRAFCCFRLDPLGNTVRKGNHHSILKAGYSFMLDVVEHLWHKYKNYAANWKYEGLVKFNGITCHKIILNNPDFSYQAYKIQNGDNLETLSRKFKVCDYLIFEKNPQIKSFDEIKPGTEILVPSDYAKQIVMYIDETKMLPVCVKAFDDKGLFEEYIYSDIVINPVFKTLEFDNKNPAYGFK